MSDSNQQPANAVPQNSSNQVPVTNPQAPVQQPVQSAYRPQPAGNAQPHYQQQQPQPQQPAMQGGYRQPMPYVPGTSTVATTQPAYIPVPAKKRSVNGFAIAGLVLSLIATVVVLGRFSNYISPFGVVGLVLSIIGYMVNTDEEDKVGSRTARIFSIVGAVLSLLAIILTLYLGITEPSPYRSWWL